MTETFDVVVIGSGPAGLSAAAHGAELGLSHILIEKTDHLSDTIFKYQKGKHIMATPDQLVLRSDVDFNAGSRENILQIWNEQSEAGGINVLYETEVVGISGEKGNFELSTNTGKTIRAATVILAIGTQGNPNTMRCPGGDLPFIQYQLDDPDAYFDEDIIVIGGGDAGIENALGLCANPDLENRVTLLQRAPDFPKAKEANVKALMQAKADGRMDIITQATTSSVEPGWINLDVKDGTDRIPCDRVIARMGSAPPRKFIESCGVRFSSEDRLAFPVLTESFESTTSGIYVVGALAGYPLIKHCMNQGYDVVEHINGNTDLKPADEPLLQKKFSSLPGNGSVSEWLEFFRTNISIFKELTPLQMREFMLDSDVHALKRGATIFEYNDIGSSLYSIASGSVDVHIDPDNFSRTVNLGESEIFGETGLISGRRRNSTITAGDDCILVETPRNAARKLITTVPAVKRTIDQIATERQLLQIFGSGLQAKDLAAAIEDAEISTIKAGQAIITEGDEDTDIYIIRSGSMVVEKLIGDKKVFLSYVPAGSYVGEMALFDDGRRAATVKAAIKSDVIKLKGAHFEKLWLKTRR